jgi:hypothetical protein
MTTIGRWWIAWLALLFLAWPLPARSGHWSGLDAVAVSPDGRFLATGGQSRVIFLLDTTGPAVQRRIWIGARVTQLLFSRDGTRLLVEDDSDTLHLLDTKTWKPVARVEHVRGAVAAARADRVVVRSRAAPAPTGLRILSLQDGSDQGLIEMKEGVSAWALDAEGKNVVVLTLGREGDERKVPPGETPRNLEGLARREFQLRNDGQVAWLRVLEATTGKTVREARTWYTSDSGSTRLFVAGDVIQVTNFNNSCARIAADGTTTLFETGVLFNYTTGWSPDARVLVAGGLREGTWGEPGGKRVRFAIEALPGADEFLTAAVVQPDGSAWLGTSGYRLLRVSREGKVEKVVPVY